MRTLRRAHGSNALVDTWIIVALVAGSLVVILPRLLGARGASVDVVKQKLQAGATVVDVRSPSEFRAGAYPRAVNIPVQELAHRVGEIPRDRPVVLYCASGMRSGSAAAHLKRLGYPDVVNAGGLGDMPR